MRIFLILIVLLSTALFSEETIAEMNDYKITKQKTDKKTIFLVYKNDFLFRKYVCNLEEQVIKNLGATSYTVQKNKKDGTKKAVQDKAQLFWVKDESPGLLEGNVITTVDNKKVDALVKTLNSAIIKQKFNEIEKAKLIEELSKKFFSYLTEKEQKERKKKAQKALAIVAVAFLIFILLMFIEPGLAMIYVFIGPIITLAIIASM